MLPRLLLPLFTFLIGLLLLGVEGQRTGFRGVATNLPRDFQYRDPETVSASIAVGRFARSFQASVNAAAERNQRTPSYHQAHPKPKFVTREKSVPGIDLDAREIFDFVDSRYLQPLDENRFNKALDEVEIERATSAVRLLPGEGLPPTPAPQFRPGFFPEGRHNNPLPPAAAAPASYQATPSPYFAAAPAAAAPVAAAVSQIGAPSPAVPYAQLKSLPYHPPAATPAPYLLSPDPYVAKKPAPYVGATPAPYVTAGPAHYVTAGPAPYAAPTPAPYVAVATPAPYVAAATPAPYAVGTPAPALFAPQSAYYSTLISLGGVAEAPAAPPPPPPAPVAPKSISLGPLGPAPSIGISAPLPGNLNGGHHSSASAAGNYVSFSLNHEKLQ